MKCSNCGADNVDGAKFCRKCGTPIEKKIVTHQQVISSIQDKDSGNNNVKIIIAVIAVIAVVLGGAFLYFSDSFGFGEVPLHEEDFEIFKMQVPDGSNFVETTSVPDYGNIGGFVFLENGGDYSDEVFMLSISTLTVNSPPPSDFKLEETDGDITIYKSDEGGQVLYWLDKEIDKYTFSLMGSDVNTMKKMMNSIKITDSAELSAESTSQSTQTPSQSASTQTQSNQATPMTINGGTFSTGSSLSDKTYAKIYVGSDHAGENVKIQIFYSRDGATLNNGNMVPKTVSSDGYIEVRSAEAYEYYPDFAEINLYDSSGKLLDTQSVSLSPESGSQSF